MWLVVGIVVVVIFVVLMYNTLINRKNQVDNIFASVDAILQKRYNLIPNLVSSVKEYMEHEKSVLEKITTLRSNALKSNITPEEKIEINKEISSALKSIMIAVENYPNLKANENFLHLQKSLNEIEEQISAARRAYNQAVTDYNNAIEMLPTNILAKYMGYERKRPFEADEIARINPNVKDLFN